MIDSVASAIILSCAALLALDALRRRFRRIPKLPPPAPRQTLAELKFDGTALQSTDGETEMLLSDGHHRGPILERLGERFPDLAVRLNALGGEGSFDLEGLWPGEKLHLTLRGPFLEIRLSAPSETAQTSGERREIELLREALASSPLPIWRSNAAGETIWANRAYLASLPEVPQQWPLPSLPPSTSGHKTAAGFHYALPDSPALGDVYTELPMGLGIFDAQKRLQSFNPALTDLLDLPITALIAQPHFEELLQLLKRTHPNATFGQPPYHLWHLNDQNSVEVTLQDTANGGLRLYLCDISAQMQQIARLQEGWDALGEALALFDQNGIFLQANAIYHRLFDAYSQSPRSLLLELQMLQNRFGALSLQDGWQPIAEGRLALSPTPNGHHLLRIDLPQTRAASFRDLPPSYIASA